MRRVATMLATAATVLMVAGVYAQGKDFSGTWSVDQEKTTAANPAMAGGGGGGGGRGGGRGGGGPMTIAMDAKTMKITTQGQNGEQVATYNLDGTVTKVPAGRGGEGDAKCTWEGNKLKVEITSQGQNGPQTQTSHYYMDGAWLVREQQIPARGDNPASSRKTYFKKG